LDKVGDFDYSQTKGYSFELKYITMNNYYLILVTKPHVEL